MRPARRDFRDKQQLAEALAEAVAGNLKSGVKARGAASLAVSGGSTPARSAICPTVVAVKPCVVNSSCAAATTARRVAAARSARWGAW